jgi:hypothetical protein
MLLALSPMAHADTIPSCSAPTGVTTVDLPSGIAPAVLKALHDKIGDIALPGQPFDATDTETTGKSRRFIFVWHTGSKWIVATEHGGRGYSDPIFLYNLSDDGKTASRVGTRLAFHNGICADAVSLSKR